MLIKLTNLLDEAKCYEVIRQLRWPDGVVCLQCRGTGVVRNGHDDRERHRQRYLCKTCRHRFDDLTGTVLAGHHQPVSTWILGSYVRGVNLVWAFQCQAVSYSSLQCVHPYVRSEEPSLRSLIAADPAISLSRYYGLGHQQHRPLHVDGGTRVGMTGAVKPAAAGGGGPQG